MRIAYHQTTQPEIVSRVRDRYAPEITLLKGMGFAELCFYTEAMLPFSLLLLFPIVLLMRAQKEVIQIQSPLRIAVCCPILVAREHATYAVMMGYGVKFYTNFTDGTGLISANFPSFDILDQKGKLYKYAAPQPIAIESAWGLHRDRIESLRAEGKQVRNRIGFEDFVELSAREDQSA